MNTEDWLKQEFHDWKKDIVFNREKLQETIAQSRAVYQKSRKKSAGIKLFRLAIRQIPYMGRQTWILQAVLSFILMGLIRMQMQILRDVQMAGDPMGISLRFSAFLCVSGLLAAWSNVPLLLRPVRWKMAEIEAAACYSKVRIYLARLMITGAGTMVMMTGIGVYMYLSKLARLQELGIYLLFPFLLMGSLILYFLRKARWNQFLIQCSGAGILLLLLFVMVRKWSMENGYLITDIPVWFLCTAAAMACVVQIWLLEKEEKKQWSLA